MHNEYNRAMTRLGLPMCGVEMDSCKIQTYQNKAKNLCTISFFVFDLDGECKFFETKHYSD